MTCPGALLKVIEKVRENNKLITEYDVNADELIKWIQVTTIRLQEREFANTLVGVQQQMMEFNQYRTQEKPPRYVTSGVFDDVLTCTGSVKPWVEKTCFRNTLHW